MYLKNKGFTLIELVISITLSVVIIVILLAAMRLAYKSQAKGSERVDITQRTRILGDRLTWLIRGAYPFFVNKADEQKLFFEGESDRIGFVTTSVDSYGKGPEDSAGLKWVTVFADRDGLKIREKVFFLEDVFDDEGGKVYLLDPGVKKLEFEYYDVPEDEKQGEQTGDWVSEWDPDEKKYIPAAVKFRITFEHEDKTVEMPEIIARINAQRMTGNP
ncbi:MAG: prepilin-type N-terminal cleavage/methylation domain-containing protein [Nitrospirota bacterium]|nr:prepilin-type N-terminal cleavage/methylation domain-containing protein [Nitrospirota bacterium]